MKLFSRKKSNTAIKDDQPPSISRPRAQGHLPPTTGPRPSNPSRRSFSSAQTSAEPGATPLYARFARADSFESLNLRGKADSRAPSFAPTQTELEANAQELGYDRPWAADLMNSLDNAGSSLNATSPEPAAPTMRLVSNPPSRAAGTTGTIGTTGTADRKSAADTLTTNSKRLSLDAMAAQDPFMASKMQSVLRRAPTNVKVPEPESTSLPLPKPSASRSTTAPPPAAQPNRPTPAPRAPTAPPAAAPSRSTSTPTSINRQAPPPSRTNPSIRSVSTTTTRGGPPPTSNNYRPSLDGPSSDDGMSTFSHSQAGHGQMRPMYPSLAAGINGNGNGHPQSNGPPGPVPYSNANGVSKRERGPPPVAGTPSAYAWKSGQSDDGHGGSSFYTGGSQNNPTGVMGLGSLPPLPPGAAPPNPYATNAPTSYPYGPPNTNAFGPSTPYGPTHSQPRPAKRTPSNPPVSRVPHPSTAAGGHSRRMSVDGGGAERPLSGGPGTWGGSAIGPAPGTPQNRERERERAQDTQQQRAFVPAVKSVKPGEIFHHPQMGGAPPARPSVAPGPTPPYGPTTGRPTEGEGERGRSQVGRQGTMEPSGPFRGAAVEATGRQSPFKAGGNVAEGRSSPPKPSERRASPTKTFEGRASPAKFVESPTKMTEERISPIKPSPSPLSADNSSAWSGRTVNGASSAATLDGTGSATAGSVRTIDTSSVPPRAATLSPSNLNGTAPLSVPATSPGRSSTFSTNNMPPASPAKSTAVAPPSPAKSEAPVRTAVPTSPLRSRELPHPPTSTQPHPPTSHREPSLPRAPSSVSSYGTAMPIESDIGSDAGPAPSKLALAGLAPINTAQAAGRSSSPTPTTSSAAPTSAMLTARMTPTTSAAMSPVTIPSIPSSTPARTLGAPRAVSPSPSATTMRLDEPSESDGESHGKKRNLLVKTRKMDGASSFRSSDERSERPTSVVPQPESPGPGLGLNGGEDPFARAPPTIVKSVKKAKAPLTPDVTPDPNQHEGETTPRQAMPLSPPLSSDEHDAFHTPTDGLDRRHDARSPMTPALTDEAPPMEEIEDMEEEEVEPESTTPPGSPPLPKIYPLTTHLNMPSLLAALLPFLSFRDWNALNALNAGLRRQLEETRALREEVLEYWLRGVGYSRWTSPRREVLPLGLRDLNAYMRGVSIAVYRYSAIAESFLAVRAQQEQTNERVPGAASKGNLVRALASSCRAYTKVILRLREQAECMHRDGDFRSPLFRPGHAPLLRVFVPSKEGAWLSDGSVLDCEKELKRAGAIGVLRVGDVIWDAAVGDEGNAGRMVWDGNYLVDLDYTYSTTGELPKYIHSLAFSPSYWHKVIRTSNSPLCHFDLSPYAVEIAQNLQLVQDRVQTETPQGGRHTVVRWVHRSRFHPRPGMPIPATSPPTFVDRTWEGIIVVEVEGTNEGLADLQTRVGPGARLFPAKTAGMEIKAATGKSPFRLLRSMSRPGEIWIRAVREKERLG